MKKTDYQKSRETVPLYTSFPRHLGDRTLSSQQGRPSPQVAYLMYIDIFGYNYVKFFINSYLIYEEMPHMWYNV